MKEKILVIGETCKDVFVYGESTRLCPEAPAPVFNPFEESCNPGMAMNVQRNIISLGEECDIYTNENWQSVTKTRLIHKNTNQMFIRVDEGDDKIDRCSVESLDLKKYSIVVISDYCKGFLTEEDIEHITKQHDCVFLDTKKRLGSWAKNTKFIKINNFEYNKTEHTLSDAMKQKMIVTLGSKGCMYQDKTYPVKKVEIKDVSGAGDTFLSALVVEYMRSRDILSAIAFANDCATQIVQKRGVSII